MIDLLVLGLQFWHQDSKDKFAVDVVTRPVLPQESQIERTFRRQRPDQAGRS